MPTGTMLDCYAFDDDAATGAAVPLSSRELVMESPRAHYAEGVKRERSAIVAWLDNGARRMPGDTGVVLRILAEQIQKGSHHETK